MRAPRLVSVLHREIRGLHEAAYVLAFFTLASQVIALVRDRIFAHQFGVGETLDLFYAAFRVPDVLYALLASVVSVFVLIPFIEEAEHEGVPAVRRFLSDIFTVFSGALICGAAVAWVAAPTLVGFLYGGFTESAQHALVPVLRVLLLQPLILGVSNLCAAYVQTKGRFVLYAFAPILYNLGVIVGAVLLYPRMGIAGLAWGVVLGAFLHLGVQVPYMIKEGVLPRVTVPDWARVVRVVRLSLPRSLTLSMQQIVLLVLVALASYIAVGSVSAFTFAWNLTAVPLALIGASYSVAAFPTLARLFGDGDLAGYRAVVVRAAQQIIFLALPVTMLVVVLRTQIVRVVLGTGAFDAKDVALTAAVMAVLVLSLAAQGLVLLLVRACYAARRTRIPLFMNMAAAAVTIGMAGVTFLVHHGELSTMVTRVLPASGVVRAELLTLACAYSAGALVNVLLLAWYFERYIEAFVGSLYMTARHALGASFGGGCAAYLVLTVTAGAFAQNTAGVLLQGVLAGVAGCGVWLGILVLVKNEELRAAYEALRLRLLRKKIPETTGAIE